MAAASDYLNALQFYHPDVQFSGIQSLNDAANSAASSGMSTSDFVNQNMNNPGIFQAYNQKYQTMAQPQLASIGGQINQENNQLGLSDQSTANSSNTVNNDAANAERNMKVQGMGQADSIANAADKSGIGNAGTTLVQQNNNNQDVTRNVSYTEANRANSLAQLAIQNAGTKAGIQGTIDSLQGQEGAINYNTALNSQQDYNQDSATMFDRANTLFNDSLALPAGRSAQIMPGYTVNGTKIDANGAVSAIQNLLPVLGQPGVQSLLSAVLPQYGINLTADQISKLGAGSSAPSATVAKTSYSTGGGGGGGSYVAPIAPKTNNPAPASPSQVAGPGRSGAPISMEMQVTPYLTQYFKAGGYQGQDKSDLASLQKNFPGLTGPEASYLYYTTRKAITGH